MTSEQPPEPPNEREQALHKEIHSLQQEISTLRQQKTEIENLYSNAPVALCMFDRELRYVHVNKKLAELNGFPAEEHIGRTFKELVPHLAESLEPIMRRVIDSGIPVSRIEITAETPGCAGTPRNFLTSWLPVRDRDGSVAGLNVVIEETTGQKQAEATLQESEQRLCFHVENSPLAIIEWDTDFIVTRWSGDAEKMFGWSRAEIIGKPLRELNMVYEEDIPAVQQAMKRLSEGLSKHVVSVNRNYTKDRKIIHCEWYNSVLTNAQGKMVSVMSQVLNITERRLAEEALQASKSKLEAALASMTDAVFITDVEGNFVNFNEAFAVYHRFKTMEGCARTLAEYPAILEVTLADGTPAPMARWAAPRALNGETATDVEYILRRRDTGETWVGSYNFAPVRDKDGAIIGSVVIGRDITARKDIERELEKRALELERANEELLAERRFRDTSLYARSLIETSLDPLVTINAQGKIMDVNRATELATGIPRDQLIGTEFSDYFTEPEKAREGYQKVFSEGYVRDYPLAILHTTGTVMDVLYNASLFTDDRGKVKGIFAAARDMTAQKKAELALRESEREFRLLAEAMPQIVWVTRQDGWNIYFNRQWVDYTGLTLEESYGHGWNKPFHPDDQKRAWDAWQNAVTHNGTYSLQCRLRRRDGVYQWWLIRGVPVFDEQGAISKWFGTCTDINNLMEIEEKLKETVVELERSNRELQQFAYATSHDLQEPLRMIKSFTQLLEKHYREKLDAEGEECIGFIVDGVSRMQHMIDDILDFSRVASGAIPLADTDLNKVLTRALENLMDSLKQSGAIVTHDTLPGAVIDELQFTQLFQNLISNSIKFRREEPLRVHVGAERQDDSWLISVRDNGIWIDESYFEKIFVLFQRLNSRKKYSGSGIGLAICKKIVERHGGIIWVESIQGEGSTFYFTIPVKQPKQ